MPYRFVIVVLVCCVSASAGENRWGVSAVSCQHSECTDAAVDACGCHLFGCAELSSCGETCSGKLLGGLIQPSDHCFDDFVSPMINFVFFEDPRTLTELRPIFVNHWVPNQIGNGVAAGGTVQLYALQFRAALTDRLSLIAVKDGFIVDNTDGALDTLLADGWADVSAGLKYNLHRDPCRGSLLSAGLTYEMPVGSTRALQDVGDGEFHLFLTGGQRLADGRAHLLSSFGYRLPVDTSVQNTAIHWSNHLDAKIADNVYLFTELAWWHWTDDAGSGLPGIAGQDLFNLTASDVAGNDLVTQSVGVKIKPNALMEIGVMYEFPLTDYEDIVSHRVMVDYIIRY